MIAEASLRLHAVAEEHAFARATFETADHADAALSSLKVVQREGEISLRDRRCEQQQHILNHDQLQIDQRAAALKVDEDRLTLERSSLQEQETAFVVQAQTTELAYQAQMIEKSKIMEDATSARCLAMEHYVDQQCSSEVQSLKLAEDSFLARQLLIEASAAEYEVDRARLTRSELTWQRSALFSTCRSQAPTIKSMPNRWRA